MARRPADKKKKTLRRRLRPQQPQREVFSAVLPSNPSRVDPIVQRAMAALKKRCSLDGYHEAIELALREALANAILHGNAGKRRKRVALNCYQKKDKSILLVVRDQGRGFDPETVPDPTAPENLRRETGRGIFLIRKFMDQVDFAKGGCEIRMIKEVPRR